MTHRLAPARTVVFSPHPDDDVLGCGGTIVHRLQAGHVIDIVYLTDGRNSHSLVLGIVEQPTPAEVAIVRQAEAWNAAEILGVTERGSLSFLEFEDGSLAAHSEEATIAVRQILAELSPTEVFYPSSCDQHPDHRATHEIVEAAISTLPIKPDRYCYTIWAGESLSPCEHKTRMDIKDVVGLKREAIEEHRSQLEVLYPSQSSPVLSSTFIENFLADYEEFSYTPSSKQDVIRGLPAVGLGAGTIAPRRRSR